MGPQCNGSMFKDGYPDRIRTANFLNSTIRKRSRFESWGLHQDYAQFVYWIRHYPLKCGQRKWFDSILCATKQLSETEQACRQWNNTPANNYGCHYYLGKRCDDPRKLINDVYNKIVLQSVGVSSEHRRLSISRDGGRTRTDCH